MSSTPLYTAPVTITTDRVRVYPEDIPVDAVAVTWQRVKDQNVWVYRFHKTERAAKMRNTRNDTAYNRFTYAEWGWKIVTNTDREAGLWLW